MLQATNYAISSKEIAPYFPTKRKLMTVWTVYILNEDESIFESREFVNDFIRDEWIASFGLTPPEFAI